MGRSYAGILGPLAFSVLVARGVLHASSPVGTLAGACLGLVVFSSLGFVIGHIAGWIVEDSLKTQLQGQLAARQAAAQSGERPQNQAA